MTNPFTKMRGDGAALPARAQPRQIALAWAGAMLAIGTVGALASAASTTLLLGSFGASCVLVFGFPDVPFSQPRNVVVGHVMSTAIGLLCLHLLGPGTLSLALAVATASAAMLATRTVHPPAGSNPVIVFLGHAGWSFLLLPTLAGACVIVAIALLFNNLVRAGRYPKYW